MTARRPSAAIALVLAVSGAWGWRVVMAPLPPLPAPAEVRAAYRPSDARLVDRWGEVLQERRVDPTRRRLDWTPLGDVSPALRAAVVLAEDRRFPGHGGVDVRALAAAAVRRLAGGPRRGGSTITMQLAALLGDGREGRGRAGRTLAQKWRQMRQAWALETRWSKAEILEAYLNLVTFRGEVQGVGAAARLLLGKTPHGLTEAESAVLAALLRAPNAEPAAVARRALALVEAGRADGPDPAAAGAGEPAAGEALARLAARALDGSHAAGPAVDDAPHAAARLLDPGRPAEPVVRSTLDGGLQRVAAAALRRQLLALRDRRVEDGAVVVVDNASGDVLAYVGGSGELASRRHVDGVRARRQAGSTLKPFLYGLAFEQRLLTPATRLLDAPLELPAAGGVYRPRNYDEAFRGLVPARVALAASLNVPAVRAVELVGPEVLAAALRRLGLGGVTETGDFYGPALALGAADVSLWELAGAYRALARGGEWTPLRLRPDEPPGEARRVLSPAAAFLVGDILAGRDSRSATFGLESPLATRAWTAVKTGTSRDMRDNWAVGYSRRHTVGVWVGNFSGAPMRDVSGMSGAAPAWAEIMAWLQRDGAAAALAAPPAPPGVVRVAGQWLLAGTEPTGAPAAAGTAPAGGQPRIVAPAAGVVIALDPDIPRGRQRVPFQAEAVGPAVRWVLDGAPLGPAAGLSTWTPEAGDHELALVDAGGRVLDRVAFQVRGAAASR